jgi:hypothetical protein
MSIEVVLCKQLYIQQIPILSHTKPLWYRDGRVYVVLVVLEKSCKARPAHITDEKTPMHDLVPIVSYTGQLPS